jgi:Xaa-Pro aminopeptidase
MGELQVGESCKKYQQRVCEFFETLGHNTTMRDPQTKDGFVHSLGHGLGLNLHEHPYFGSATTDRDRLDPGVIVTIEPGLYYPDQGLGVRLEDTIWVRPDGQFEILADYPYDLVLPVKNMQ